MAIYLFILLSISILANIIRIIREPNFWERIGVLVGMSVVVPPCIWLGWFSGLIF